MKKLLILGGSRYIVPVIKKAHELGIFVITCDYLPDNYAHKFADKYLNISIIDKDMVLDAARKENIDGIISFACDPGVITACYVAEQLGLPNVGPFQSVSILQNKQLFRDYLKNNGFNVPFHKSYSTEKSVLEDIDNLVFPLIVKPVDSAGSKGVSKVTNKKELIASLPLAFACSIKKEIIIEEFLEKRGESSDSDSFYHNGKLLYFGVNSQLFDKNAKNPFTPAAYYWPSTMSDQSVSYLKNELERLFGLLKMKTAIFNIEVRENKDGKPFIMEASPRGGGNRLTEMVRFGTGLDFIEEYVKYSVGLDISPEEKISQRIFNKWWCEIILHSQQDGLFEKVSIVDSIKRFLIEKDIWVDTGNAVSAFTGANQTIGTLIFEFDEKSQMIEVVNNIDKFIKVHVK